MHVYHFYCEAREKLFAMGELCYYYTGLNSIINDVKVMKSDVVIFIVLVKIGEESLRFARYNHVAARS